MLRSHSAILSSGAQKFGELDDGASAVAHVAVGEYATCCISIRCACTSVICICAFGNKYNNTTSTKSIDYVRVIFTIYPYPPKLLYLTLVILLMGAAAVGFFGRTAKVQLLYCNCVSLRCCT